ncbi:hypothetical protein [Tychonema sp. LEGE 07203]|uniref:hypothetical protein n=1 Tax=Tychonema sp. LEGE 07203 TaxID=1828671 RepID=UPI001D14577F|nr:hypothetical protein [Tychonema sp. LEGE 07203]
MIDFLRRCREMMSPTKWKYWQGICQVIKGQLLALLRTPIHVAVLVALVWAHCLIHLFTYAEAEEFAMPNEEELPKPETARAPPKRFIPIPDAEIGGCARNDSLIAPAI